MIWRADTREIYVFSGAGPGGYYYTKRDTWDPSQPVGGGPGPTPGLYEPSRGFGKVWRESEGGRQQLGYTTAPEEPGYTLTIQTSTRAPPPSPPPS